jgi:hypothetical protein
MDTAGGRVPSNWLLCKFSTLQVQNMHQGSQETPRDGKDYKVEGVDHAWLAHWPPRHGVETTNPSAFQEFKLDSERASKAHTSNNRHLLEVGKLKQLGWNAATDCVKGKRQLAVRAMHRQATKDDLVRKESIRKEGQDRIWKMGDGQ